MKILVNTNQNNRVVDTFEDSAVITISSDNVTIDDDLIFLDLNSSNSAVHEDATLPEDFVAHKYNYNGTSWAIKENWQGSIS